MAKFLQITADITLNLNQVAAIRQYFEIMSYGGAIQNKVIISP